MADLSPEAQSAIIKVAGDWSLAIANKQYPIVNPKAPFVLSDYSNELYEYFKSFYHNLISIVQE